MKQSNPVLQHESGEETVQAKEKSDRGEISELIGGSGKVHEIHLKEMRELVQGFRKVQWGDSIVPLRGVCSDRNVLEVVLEEILRRNTRAWSGIS